MVNKTRFLTAVTHKKYLMMTPIKYNEEINKCLLMGSVSDQLKASAVATLHPPIFVIGTLRLLS